MAAEPPSWPGLLGRGLVLTILAAAFGTVAMLPAAALPLGHDFGRYWHIYLAFGLIYGAIFAAPITLALLPVLRRHGAPLRLPAAVASALWMVAAPRLTNVTGLFAPPKLNPDLALILVGALAGVFSAWLLAAWTRPAAITPRQP
ncbi:MAG TPA: hypothetical protein VGM87_06350 [Roseomonas sp.]|jgi:hypothetical protein